MNIVSNNVGLKFGLGDSITIDKCLLTPGAFYFAELDDDNKWNSMDVMVSKCTKGMVSQDLCTPGDTSQYFSFS